MAALAQPIDAGSKSELRPECSIEVGNISKAALKGDVEDCVFSRGKPQCRVAKARAQNVLMWGDARQTFKGT